MDLKSLMPLFCVMEYMAELVPFDALFFGSIAWIINLLESSNTIIKVDLGMFSKTASLTSTLDYRSLEKGHAQFLCHYEDINNQIFKARRTTKIHTEDKDHIFPALFLTKSPTRLSEPHLDTPKNRPSVKNHKKNPFYIRKLLLQTQKTQTIKQGISSTCDSGPSKKLSIKMSRPLDRYRTVKP